jgi:hypothetical protein
MSMFLSCDTISMKNLLSVTLKFSMEGHNCKQQHDILYTQEEQTSTLLYMYSNMEEMESYFM